MVIRVNKSKLAALCISQHGTVRYQIDGDATVALTLTDVGILIAWHLIAEAEAMDVGRTYTLLGKPAMHRVGATGRQAVEVVVRTIIVGISSHDHRGHSCRSFDQREQWTQLTLSRTDEDGISLSEEQTSRNRDLEDTLIATRKRKLKLTVALETLSLVDPETSYSLHRLIIAIDKGHRAIQIRLHLRHALKVLRDD